MKLTLGNTEFEFDIYNADTAQKYETAILKMKDDLLKASGEGAEGIIEQCIIVCDFIDAVLGAGASGEIFGDTVSLTCAMDVMEAVVNSVVEQKMQMQQRAERFRAISK